jgi:hypothetical protein
MSGEVGCGTTTMIRIQEIATAGQFITLLKPVGKEVPLRLGEILEGQVVDIFPEGGLTIKVKGGFLPARTGLDFQKDQNIQLKVLNQRGPKGELILQVIDQKPESLPLSDKLPIFPNSRQQTVEILTRQLSNLIGKLTYSGGNGAAGAVNGKQALAVETGQLNHLLESLLKALPANIELIPKTIRVQLQHILQYSLTGLGKNIQERVALLLSHMAEDMNEPLLGPNLKDRLLVSIEDLVANQIKTALENSGVALEAKLKSLSAHPSDDSKINKDLKAILLQIKETMEQEEGIGSKPGLIQKMNGFGTNSRGEVFPAEPKIFSEVDSLLKDINTFQLLSKVSDSFWTFLPVQWQELKNGDLVFKRRTADNGDVSYSCGIHLDLGEEMGPISVFMVYQFRDFNLTLKIDHPGLKAEVDSHLRELKENFKSAGLTLRNVSLLGRNDEVTDPFDHPESGETIINIRI